MDGEGRRKGTLEMIMDMVPQISVLSERLDRGAPHRDGGPEWETVDFMGKGTGFGRTWW